MREEIEKLKQDYISAKSNAERELVNKKIAELVASNDLEVAQAALESIRETNKRVEEIVLRDKLKDILPIISLSYVSKTYFNKTRGWLYQRLNGSIVNNKQAEFTNEEQQILKYALEDIAKKISTSANIV